MYRRTIQQLKEKALKFGARDVKVIGVETVKTAAWVRFKCQFGCSGFGECFTCPPYSPTPEQTRTVLDCYRKALLIHRRSSEVVSLSGIAVRLEREAFLAGYYKALAMGSGPCMLCDACNLKGACRNRDEARPSMEACGIDVYATARANGFTIETLDSTRCSGNYFSLVLLE